MDCLSSQKNFVPKVITAIRKYLYQSEKRYEGSAAAYQSEVMVGGNMSRIGVKPQTNIRYHSEFSVIEP